MEEWASLAVFYVRNGNLDVDKIFNTIFSRTMNNFFQAWPTGTPELIF